MCSKSFFCLWLLIQSALILSALDAGAQAYCVKKNKTELKSSPQKQAAVLATVDRFTPLQGTGKKEPGWIEVVDFENEKYWVPRKSVTTAFKCLVIKKKSAKIRTGPGKDFPLAEPGTAEKSEAFKDLSGEDGWNKVESAEGKSGWVDLNNVWQPINHRFRMSFENDD